jgi:hypothetical protein
LADSVRVFWRLCNDNQCWEKNLKNGDYKNFPFFSKRSSKILARKEILQKVMLGKKPSDEWIGLLVILRGFQKFLPDLGEYCLCLGMPKSKPICMPN